MNSLFGFVFTSFNNLYLLLTGQTMMGQTGLNMPTGGFNMNNIQVPNQNSTALPLQNNLAQQLQQQPNNKNNLASSMADFLNTSNSNTPSSTFNNQLFPNMHNDVKARIQQVSD